MLTAYEDSRARAPDDEVLRRATELARIVFTQDEEFLALAPQWNRSDRHFAGIVYSHQVRATIGQLVADLQLVVELMSPEEIRDTVVFLPL